MQVKLLEVIERKELYHLGGTHPIRVDARFLAATTPTWSSSWAPASSAPTCFTGSTSLDRAAAAARHMEDLPLSSITSCAFTQETGVEQPALDGDISPP